MTHVRRTLVATLILLSVSLAGCTDDPDAYVPEAAEGDRPQESFGDIVTGPSVPPDLNTTTADLPRLVEGEWWRVRFDVGIYPEPVEVVRVVANATDDGYVIGMPHEGWLKEAISFHYPGFGDIAPDLSYEIHNERFQPVQFPLETGNTWETSFVGSPARAEVIEADDYEATIHFFPASESDPTDPFNIIFPSDPDTPSFEVVYDARQHAITKMTSAIGTVEVLEHGYDYEGWITVPRVPRAEIDYGTLPGDNLPGEETTIEIDGGYNRMTMMYFIFSLDERAAGTYSIQDTGPDGTQFNVEYEGQGSYFEFHETNEIDGTWTMTETLAGGGGVYRMGIAYIQYDIHLPTQERRQDHGHAVSR